MRNKLLAMAMLFGGFHKMFNPYSSNFKSNNKIGSGKGNFSSKKIKTKYGNKKKNSRKRRRQ